MAKVKICGITNAEDAIKAAEFGADFIGFVFVQNTPRYVLTDDVKLIISKVKEEGYDDIIFTGLFVNAYIDEILNIVKETEISCVQLHGEESNEYCQNIKEADENILIIKTFKVADEIMDIDEKNIDAYEGVDFLLFDTYHPFVSGGTGEKFNLDIIRKEKIDKPFFIAGGLNSKNVEDAVKQAKPYGVDVSSGVEKKKGYKDYNLLKEFIQNAKKNT